MYSVISVIVDSLPGNTKNRESTRSWTARVRLVHPWAEGGVAFLLLLWVGGGGQRERNRTHGNFARGTATYCTVTTATLQHTATTAHTAPHCTTLHHTAPHCNTLQHTATHTPSTVISSGNSKWSAGPYLYLNTRIEYVLNLFREWSAGVSDMKCFWNISKNTNETLMCRCSYGSLRLGYGYSRTDTMPKATGVLEYRE